MYQFKISCKNCGIIKTINTLLKEFSNLKVEWICCDYCSKNHPNTLFGICEECGNRFDISKECKCINSK
jgi:hypothetical protein